MAITTNVPSESLEDLRRDVQDATRFVNGSAIFANRTGQQIRPIPLVDSILDSAVSDAQNALNVQIPEAINALGLQYPPIVTGKQAESWERKQTLKKILDKSKK